jgi:beta-galactosidase
MNQILLATLLLALPLARGEAIPALSWIMPAWIMPAWIMPDGPDESPSAVEGREHRSLAGEWTLALDPEERGEEERWFASDLPANPIALPGTTDLAGKGYALDEESMTYPVEFLDTVWPGRGETERLDESGHLVRRHMFLGPAWYQRTIDVPRWGDRHVQLRLERVCWASKVWLDDRLIGNRDSLVAEHRFDLGSLTPGPHRLTVRIDNSLVRNIGLIGHAYGPETQSRWNGIVGRIELIATAPVFLRDVQVYPAPDRQSVRIRVRVAHPTKRESSATLLWKIRDESGDAFGAGEFRIDARGPDEDLSVREYHLPLDRPGEGWSEHSSTRYVLDLEVRVGEERDAVSTSFGFRDLRRDARQVLLDGQRLFLRGTLDCCVYPRTGHPPMRVEEWLEVLGTIREYGFNHVRFHTWCPPEAAFEAADRLGLYLAPETPFWVDDWTTDVGLRPEHLGADEAITDWVRSEIDRISEAYGNHPSFALFCIGNEFGMSGDWEVVNELLREAKEEDPRHLYNASTARRRVEADDFWVTHRTTSAVRGVGPAHTNWDFSEGVAATDLPVVAHETGQRPVFPDYDDLLPKFTGPLAPFSYSRLRDAILAAGMGDQVADFERASARFQQLQYKAEHEAFHRTPDLLGYQLLMLNDFTGQSEALVGILDPFWESKGIVTDEEVRRWNAPTVVLARFDRYVWTTDETFTAEIEVANYSRRDHQGGRITWELSRASGEVVTRGEFPPTDVPRGGLTGVGRIEVPPALLKDAAALSLTVTLEGVASNRWDLWVVPPIGNEPTPGEVLVAEGFDDEVRDALAVGRDVLLLVHGLENDFAQRTGFLSAYWSAKWWGDRFSSLGILCDPEHPALAQFPNEGHSDWQWRELTEGATTILLEGAPTDFRPIVQPITDFHHHRLLGQLFEARVGAGRLLVCGYDLTSDLERRHAARQFRRSLVEYLNSAAFLPSHELSPDLLARWLAPPAAVPLVEIAEGAFDEAALHLRAAADLEPRAVNVAWAPENDEVVQRAPGYSWRVAGGTWKDAIGAAWHGNPLEVTLGIPAGAEGVLYLHLHDWNALARRGTIEFEGRRTRLGAHDGAGAWLAYPVTSIDSEDGTITILASPTAGPNLMITEIAFVPAR